MNRTGDRQFSQLVASLTVVCLAWSTGPAAASGATQGAVTPEWQQLQTAAPGTEVQVDLTNGARVRGRLIEARPDAMLLNSNELLKGAVTTAPDTSLRGTQVFQRIDVAAVKIRGPRSRPSYRAAEGAPDAVAVRRVVAALGIGTTVNLRAATGGKLRARILTIEDGGFTVGRRGSTPGRQVAYGDVIELEPAGMHPGALAGVAAAAVAGAIFLVYSWAVAHGS